MNQKNTTRKRIFAAGLAIISMFSMGCGKSSENSKDISESNATVNHESNSQAESNTTNHGETTSSVVKIDELKIAFSPYQDADSIMTATKPLEDLIKTQMLLEGYEINKVTMTVGTSYEAVGEALSSGSVDVGFISGATYSLYKEDCDLLLTALRSKINKDSENPKDWNDDTLEAETDEMSSYYRSIILAGPSEKGQELLAKVNQGEELTWDDLNSATWAVMSPASASGYLYPSLWLNERYGKGISDLSHVVQSESYTTSLARLATEQVDLMVSYGHIRMKNANEWQNTLGGTDDILKQTGIIGVTSPIVNDTICVSKESEIMTDDVKKAFGEAMIAIGKMEDGKEIIKTFSQKGYDWGKESDYDAECEAQKLLKSMN